MPFDTTTQTALAAALATFDRTGSVAAESDLFAECLAAGWPGLDASHVEWARQQVAG